GTLILIDSGNVGSVRIDAPGYGNKTGASFAITGSIDITGSLEDQNGYKIRGQGATLDLFKFMADNTNVEYSLSVNSETGYGYLSTSQETMANNKSDVVNGCDTFYHNHSKNGATGYSEKDEKAINDAYSNFGYKNAVIYDEKEKELKTYWNNEKGFDKTYKAK
ncbi:MAG: JAB-like toxin 1 domain-containing protein, partial [Bacteroidaceae bacterium]